MTTLIRPELRALIYRAREALIGGAIILFGLWWGLGSGGLLAILGWIAVLIGAALVVSGIQRYRFRISGKGLGTVEVDEAQITYFGPMTGGAIAIDLMAEIKIDPSGKPDHWVLRNIDGTVLHIPVNAVGSEALFDAFSLLPGFDTNAMLRALNGQSRTERPVWRRNPSV